MKQVVYLNEARVHVLTGGYSKTGEAEQIRLMPGRNVVDGDLLERIAKNNDQYDAMVEDNTLTVAGDRLDVSEMDSKKAIGIIEMETTIEGVRELLAQEEKAKKPRAAVIKAANQKIKAIEDSIEKDKQNATQTEVKKKGAAG